MFCEISLWLKSHSHPDPLTRANNYPVFLCTFPGIILIHISIYDCIFFCFSQMVTYYTHCLMSFFFFHLTMFLSYSITYGLYSLF